MYDSQFLRHGDSKRVKILCVRIINVCPQRVEIAGHGAQQPPSIVRHTKSFTIIGLCMCTHPPSKPSGLGGIGSYSGSISGHQDLAPQLQDSTPYGSSMHIPGTSLIRVKRHRNEASPGPGGFGGRKLLRVFFSVLHMKLETFFERVLCSGHVR